MPRTKRDEPKRVSGETATFWGTPPGPKIQTFSDSGRGSIGRTDENSDQKMDQNVVKTNLVPDEIRVKKVPKRHQKAAIGLWGVWGWGAAKRRNPGKYFKTWSCQVPREPNRGMLLPFSCCWFAQPPRAKIRVRVRVRVVE